MTRGRRKRLIRSGAVRSDASLKMRHYYFDVKDGIYIRDDEDRKFRDDQDALQHARKVANELGRNRWKSRFRADR